ncbi:DUF5723 family protein [Roseivirga thermotolerans]|uniref:DUF5723 family protein n=1 Tax=Roseivirga thermotolerans TaxID=1758176 RepID=UPI00273F5B3D|nr:DUF5723 family protein [Roseivirga thermotolerans]
MRHFSLIISLCLSVTFCFQRLSAQQFNGFYTSDFSGVLGLGEQPASVANSPYKYDFNLVNGNIYLANNIAHTAKNSEGAIRLIRFDDTETKYVKGNASLGGLSVLLSLSRKRGVGIRYNVRSVMNGTEISPNFVAQINRFNSPEYTGRTYLNEQLNFSSATWQELAFTYGGLLRDDGVNRIKLGVTLKAVNPMGHAWAVLERADYDVLADGRLDVNRFNLRAGYSANLDGYEPFDGTNAMRIPPQGTGYKLSGADIGLVYERVAFRADPKSASGTSLHPDITYEFRVSASITDIGTMTMDYGSASFATTGLNPNANSADFNSLFTGVTSFRAFRNSLENYLTTTDVSGTYTVSLPTALRLNYDYNFGNNFYFNAAALADLSWAMPADFRVSYINHLMLTPRYETGLYGVYLPIMYNFSNDTEVGLAARYGPFTIGTHTLETLFKKEKTSAGFFFSISISQLKANARKPYCFGSSRVGSAMVRKQRTPIYKRKKFIFF